MATADIAKMAVFDARIVQEPAAYAVDKGGLSLTNSPYAAVGNSATQHTYNINVPSQNVFVDRAIDWTSYVFVKFNCALDAGVSPYVLNQPVVVFGRDCALSAFPLHELVATMTATINDTSVVINTDTVLHEVLRLTDYKKNRLVRTCPTMLDRYKSYNDAYLSINSPLNSFLEASASDEVPNGAWWDIVFCDSLGNVLSGSGSYTVSAQAYAYVAGVPVRNTAVYAADATYPIYIRFQSTEKLVLSPFIFADACEWETGLFGINNIQLVLNMKADWSRVIRTTTAGGRTLSAITYFIPQSGGGSPFASPTVNVQYLTPSLDIPLPPKSIVPYMEFPRYVKAETTAINAGATSNLQSQTIVLPQIPDFLIIYVKPNAYGATDGDYYLPITRISLNFDNFAGLLSSHTTRQLYQMSAHNGLEMDFNEWIGAAKSNKPDASGNLAIQTVGGFLVLKPGQDFALQSGQAAGLIGNFTLQFNIDVANYSSAAVTPVIYVIAANSGFFESLGGSSRIIKGVLSEADIIAAEPIFGAASRDAMKRMVGNGFMDKLGAFFSKAKNLYTATKPGISAIKGMLPEGKAKSALSAIGYGGAMSGGMEHGGVRSGGVASGGAKKNLSMRLM